MPETIKYRFRLRRRTAASWASLDEIILDSELGLESDTGRFKAGDGATGFTGLYYNNLGRVDFTGISDGDVPAWDAGTQKFKMVPQSGGSGPVSPKTTVYFCQEFVRSWANNNSGTGTTFSEGTDVVVYTGGSSVPVLSADGGAGNPGVLTLATTTGAYARAFVSGPVRLGGGKIRIGAYLKIATLSTSGERFQDLFGFFDRITGTISSSLRALYDSSVNSGNWQLSHYVGGTETTANSSIPPVADTYALLEIEINAAGTSATLYVDGVSACTIAVSITAPMRLGYFHTKLVGSASRSASLDYIEFLQELTTPRG